MRAIAEILLHVTELNFYNCCGHSFQNLSRPFLFQNRMNTSLSFWNHKNPWRFLKPWDLKVWFHFFFFSYQLFPGKGVPSIRVFREESKVGIANQNGLRLLPAENETWMFPLDGTSQDEMNFNHIKCFQQKWGQQITPYQNIIWIFFLPFFFFFLSPVKIWL